MVIFLIDWSLNKGDMYRCSAKCCDDLGSSQNEFQRCTERCSQPVLKGKFSTQINWSSINYYKIL